MNTGSFLRVRSFSPLLVVLVVLSATPAESGWRELLPIYGGPVQRIVTDSADTLYVTTPGGIFRSANAGATWTSANGDLPVPANGPITADPVAAGVVYTAITQGLYRTADSGDSWQRLPLELPAGVGVGAITVAASDTNRIYVATGGAYVYRSLDGGATWTQQSSGLFGGWGGPAFTVGIAVDPTDADRVYTTTWRGRLFRSDNAADTWYQVGGSGTWAIRGQLYVSPSDPNVLYTTHDEYWFGQGTILKSTDWGSSWSSMSRPAGVGDAGQLAIDPTDPSVVYVTTSQGIYKTTSGAASWSRVFFPPAGQITMESLAIGWDDANRVFAGSYHSGFYRSLDAGSSWTQNNTGIAATVFTGLELCRDVPATVYTGVQGTGYLKSTDGGDSWSPVGTAQGFSDHSQGGLAVHPQDPDVMITSTYQGGTPKTWRTLDGGANFTVTNTGYRAGWFRFNPHTPNRVHTTLADSQGGMGYSSNTGASWSVPYYWYIYARKFDFHPVFPEVVFSIGNRYTGSPLNTLYVMWSNNGGGSWTGTSFGLGSVYDLALDQNDPETLYVAGRAVGEGSEGIYRFTVSYSGSSVASVTRVPGTFNHGLTTAAVRRMVYDPANARLYAATTGSVYTSDDQAASWTSIGAGLPHVPSGTAMAVTPDGSRLLLGTSGGVWEYTDAQPPVALCADVEAAAGPSCVADASVDDSSYDPDGEYLVLEQDPAGPYPRGETEVELTATDGDGLSDSCAARVTVQDATAPAVACNAPDTITPPDAPISFTVTATDNCAVGAVTITGFDCWAINGSGKRIDKTDSCVVEIDGDTVTIADSGGVGDHIEWTVEATDDSGLRTEALCGPVEVVRPGRQRR